MPNGPAWSKKLRTEIAKAVVGQDVIVERLLVALLANGHVLLEGMPGLAKTLLIKSLGQALGVKFERIQFTPDLLPSDVVGTMIFQPKEGTFAPHRGPIFAKQALPSPFFVMATQNPIEQEGTYPLPEAQTDRFLFKLIVDYPSMEEEGTMMQRWGLVTSQPALTAVSSGQELLALRQEVDRIHVAPEVHRYILSLVRSTRMLAERTDNPAAKRQLNFGASPRASLALYQSGRALAWLRGDDFVSPALLQELAPDILRHRLGLTYEAEAEEITTDRIIGQILARTPVPTVTKS
jgi:MoxR-like ATPase